MSTERRRVNLKLIPMLDIKPGELVLEVGSGDKPHPRSDVLLDKFPQDSSEREAGLKNRP